MAPGDGSRNGPTHGFVELQSHATHSTKKKKKIQISLLNLSLILSTNSRHQLKNKRISILSEFLNTVLQLTKKKKITKSNPNKKKP